MKPIVFELFAVTFWHKICLQRSNQANDKMMNTFYIQYETEKKNAVAFMKNGQISAYLNSLVAMNKYKNLMIAVVSN